MLSLRKGVSITSLITAGSRLSLLPAFGSDDPGLGRVAQNFFNLDPNTVDANLSFPDFLDHTNIAQFAASIPRLLRWVPRNAWIGMESSIRVRKALDFARF